MSSSKRAVAVTCVGEWAWWITKRPCDVVVLDTLGSGNHPLSFPTLTRQPYRAAFTHPGAVQQSISSHSLPSARLSFPLHHFRFSFPWSIIFIFFFFFFASAGPPSLPTHNLSQPSR
ncbi:hypothetical protein HGRIS_010028 [Hohenbuehelia grisea]|uniref:Uncharacterized protein n=1 Tax=Hohenbuehelia grisea TaxID=104357 RepID=A0ABR3J4H5_9AGAR